MVGAARPTSQSGVVARGEWGTQAYLASLPRPPSGALPQGASPSRPLTGLQLPAVGAHPVVHQYQTPQYSQPPTPAHRPPPVLPEAQGVFEAFDVDRRGALDVAQLRAALTSLGVKMDASEAAAVLARYDANANNLLELAEFNRLVADLRQYHEQRPRAASPGALARPITAPPAAPPAGVPRAADPEYYTAEEAMRLARLAVEQAMRGQAYSDAPPPPPRG